MDGASAKKAFDTDSSRVLWLGTVCAVGIIAIPILYFFNPAGSGLYAPCPFHWLTGFYCPGCGSLRAMHQLLHGHVIRAFGLNPLLVLSLPFVVCGILSHFMPLKRGRPLLEAAVPAVYIWVYLGIVLAFWLARNIPVYPLSLLAP
jgi:hypothetical protein